MYRSKRGQIKEKSHINQSLQDVPSSPVTPSEQTGKNYNFGFIPGSSNEWKPCPPTPTKTPQSVKRTHQMRNQHHNIQPRDMFDRSSFDDFAYNKLLKKRFERIDSKFSHNNQKNRKLFDEESMGSEDLSNMDLSSHSRHDSFQQSGNSRRRSSQSLPSSPTQVGYPSYLNPNDNNPNLNQSFASPLMKSQTKRQDTSVQLDDTNDTFLHQIDGDFDSDDDVAHSPMDDEDEERVPFRITYDNSIHNNPFSPERRRSSHQPTKSNGSENNPKIVPYFSRYLEDFVEIDTLGIGSFGKVMKCRNRYDGMLYAVKQTSRFIKGEKHAASVLREVHALATLVDNPYVVRYYSAWIEDNRLFVQTELCDGGNLFERIQKKIRFSEDQLFDILNQVSNGLHLMHTRSLFHLDLKPENIYQCGESKYKIGDLGLVASSLEKERDLMEGDCRYLAKEVLNDSNVVDLTKVDIFALGATLYELASGDPLPENGKEWKEIRKGILQPLPNYSENLANIIRAMMHPNPNNRPTALQIIQHDLVRKRLPNYEELFRTNAMLEQLLWNHKQIEDSLRQKICQLENQLNVTSGPRSPSPYSMQSQQIKNFGNLQPLDFN